ncbi:MAG: glycosyltransferase family 39 protein, partial [Patescibacteria group bacterium]
LFLRVYNLSSIPLGFHIDEASLSYNGYSLLETYKDENNNKLPLYIDMFGDQRPSGYHYLTILPIKFLGLNEFATRLPGALFGSLSVLSIFFLAQVLFKRRLISLISAFLISIAPWSVVLSRASAETIVALFFIITGYTFFIVGFKKKKVVYFFAGAIIATLSFFFYHSPRVFVPLLFISSIFYLYSVWKSFKVNKKAYLILSFILLSLVSFALVFLITGGIGRFTQVNIFKDPHVKLVMEEQIREDGTMKVSVSATRFFHNKVINYSLGLISNYFEYFSGSFLFIQGGLPVWYKVPSMGLIYLVELPFILLGVFYLLSSKDKYHKLPLIWLILSPITASITVDDIPNIQRAIVMFPMIELIAAYGFVSLKDNLSNNKYKIVIGVFAVLIAFNFLYFLHQYFIQSQIHRNWYRYEGFSEMMSIVKKDYSNFDKIVVSKSFGGIYPLVLFYMQYNPDTYQKEGSPKDKPASGFGKFFFASSACPSIDRDPKVPKVNKIIFIDNGTCPSSNQKHTYVTRKDGAKAFRIVYE